MRSIFGVPLDRHVMHNGTVDNLHHKPLVLSFENREKDGNKKDQ